jgi:hypothetical protein
MLDSIRQLLALRDEAANQKMTPVPEGYGSFTPVTPDMYQEAATQPIDLRDVQGVTETERPESAPSTPTSGHLDYAAQADDIENLLGEYRKKPQDSFMDFIKLTLARSAMSQQPKLLNALAEGAGHATIDQMALKKEADRDRLQAIKDTIDYRDKNRAFDLKEKDMANDQSYRNRYLDILDKKADQGKGTKITAALRKQGDDLIDNIVGITRGQNRAIKEGTDIDPNLRIAIHQKAEEKIRAGDTPADAYGMAIDEVVGDIGSLEEKVVSGGGWFDGPEKKVMTRGTPTPQEAAAELARRRRGQ